MTAVFKSEYFPMPEGESLPEHIDDSPSRHTDNPYERDISKYHIEGCVPEDGDFFWVAINLEDAETTRKLINSAIGRLRDQGEEGPFLLAMVGPNNEGIYSSASS